VSLQSVSKISNLWGSDPPTSQTDRQTDRQTDDMQSQYRALHYSASRGKNATVGVDFDQGWKIASKYLKKTPQRSQI